jgi:uncharacterized delta-60 repeat protein
MKKLYRLLALLFLLFPPLIHAQNPGDLDLSFVPEAGTRILGIQHDGKILAIENFGNLVRLNSDGTIDLGFISKIGRDNEIGDLVIQPDGKFLITGTFFNEGQEPYRALIRLNKDGSLDVTFANGVGFPIDEVYDVNAIAVLIDGKIVVGGSQLGEVVRLNRYGRIDNSFIIAEVGGYMDYFKILEQQDGKLIISGWFEWVDGKSIPYVTRLNKNGSLDSSFDTGYGPDDYVNTSLVLESGKVLIGGWFGAVNEIPRENIARLKSDGSLDLEFEYQEDNGVVYAIAKQGDKILMGGNKGVFRLKSNGEQERDFNKGTGANGRVNSIFVQPDGKIWISGDFTEYNEIPVNGIARLYGASAIHTTFTLINTEINSPIPGHDPIDDGGIIDLSPLDPNRLNVRVDFNNQEANSVKFQLKRPNGGVDFKSIENSAPYSLFGDNEGDYFNWKGDPPKHGQTFFLTAIAFSKKDGKGLEVGRKTIKFSFVEGPAVTGFTLINSFTNQPIPGYDPIPEGSKIDLGELSETLFNIRANTIPKYVGSVKFLLDGQDGGLDFNSFENVQPYALFGDFSGRYYSWKPRPPRAGEKYSLVAVPYSKPNGEGFKGNSFKLNFSFVSNSNINREIATIDELDIIRNDIKVIPNPTFGLASVEVRLTKPDFVTIKVIDVQGRKKYEASGFKESSFTQPLDLKGLSKGLYIIKVQIGFELISKRLVIQ